ETLPIGADKTNSPEAKHNYEKALGLLQHAARIDRITRDKQRELEIQRGTPESDIAPEASSPIYFQLARTYLKLGENEKAYQEALFTRALSPESSETSLLISEAATSTGQKDQAAVALVVGLLITQNKSLLAPLNALYQSGLDPKGCAFINNASGPVLNNACEPVHSEICEAYSDVIQIMQWNLKPEVAAQTKAIAIRQYGCTEQVLSQGKKIQEYP
ncbi:MAG TPA: hypothetical protein VLV89_11900, partial [Candidatus Acidoferrum sp.]|nr:hypothetical protein [Candidatus Acidoferrum sp.]